MSNIISVVTIDSREQKFVKKTEAFFKQKGIPTFVKPLGDFGDVSLKIKGGEFINCERKSISDFVTSYISNHVQDQAERMHKCSQNPVIIIYGEMKDLRPAAYKYPALKRINEKSISKMICNLQMNYKIPVFHVKNETQYFLKMMEIAETVYKHTGNTIKVTPNSVSQKRPDINILMQAPKIGEKTALTLLNEFGTPEKVLNASRDDLLKVKGIGDATIKDIKSLKDIFYEGVKHG